MTFEDAIARFSTHLLTAGGRSRATVDEYSRDLEQFQEIAGIGRLSQLSRSAVIIWLNELSERELAPRSRARKLSALRSFVAWALEYQQISEDPIPPEVVLPRSMYLPHAMSEGEVRAMIDAATGEDPASLRDRAIIELLYATGMRVSELCSLELGSLHLDEGFAVVTGKGNKQRLVPLGQYAIDALKVYLAGPRAEFCRHAASFNEVFLSRRGPISRSSVFRLIKKYALIAGLDASKISPHTFRHSCASHMLAHGADLRFVQELLGHSDLSTTQVYTHVEKSRMREAYQRTHPLG